MWYVLVAMFIVALFCVVAVVYTIITTQRLLRESKELMTTPPIRFAPDEAQAQRAARQRQAFEDMMAYDVTTAVKGRGGDQSGDS